MLQASPLFSMEWEWGQIHAKIQEKDLSVYQHVFITLKLLFARYQHNQHFQMSGNGTLLSIRHARIRGKPKNSASLKRKSNPSSLQSRAWAGNTTMAFPVVQGTMGREVDQLPANALPGLFYSCIWPVAITKYDRSIKDSYCSQSNRNWPFR